MAERCSWCGGDHVEGRCPTLASDIASAQPIGSGAQGDQEGSLERVAPHTSTAARAGVSLCLYRSEWYPHILPGTLCGHCGERWPSSCAAKAIRGLAEAGLLDDRSDVVRDE